MAKSALVSNVTLVSNGGVSVKSSVDASDWARMFMTTYAVGANGGGGGGGHRGANGGNTNGHSEAQDYEETYTYEGTYLLVTPYH